MLEKFRSEIQSLKEKLVKALVDGRHLYDPEKLGRLHVDELLEMFEFFQATHDNKKVGQAEIKRIDFSKLYQNQNVPE